ncbi:DUF2971 domain-containing protein [Bacillus methanolicus]|uniref:DUF2971 domain-containing protein n=1 Tax=Bacillus methanolicus (strain MGA3 / ATCC 53907) TaxID=796606 RepID=I3E2Y8_BACMM|nr:DUF2971 domain-containing protein [Bacillus methanolicus]AIE59046.1 hypothetical protein BMMGA3_02920 [Bacillus methanolicus MGA3]EIJ80859.1 hypothetical protein MGA3_11180 [Bacillus methanolicus MGA3]UQD51132.1 DUF2971 domain-containing protein [Bacillus methanolicus]
MSVIKEIDEKLSKQFWEFMGEIIRDTNQTKKVLYHYTSLDRFMGMIENNNLWMSKGNFLNDSSELIYIEKIANDTIKKLEDRIIEKYGNSESEALLRIDFLKQLRVAIEKFIHDITIDDFEVYVLSLTQNQDSLTLWYHYSKGDGYNIGFSTDALIDKMNAVKKRIEHEFNLFYGKVIYDNDQQEKMLIESLIRSFDCIYQFKDRFRFEELAENLHHHFFSVIVSFSIFFKHESFRNEEEYRIALTRRRERKHETEVLFRARNGIIIPYIQIYFAEKLPVRHVTIGPKNNIGIAKNGVEYYLRNKGYNLDEITVSKSVATLRY